MTRTIRLTLAYDGTDFHGWQIQAGERTIQGQMTDALERITGVHTHVDSSGRTDAGVHALAQVASFRTESRIPCENLVKALNSLLPPGIRVYSAEEVAEGFHARFHAKAKTYRYHIYRGPVCPPHRWHYVHHYSYALDVAAMERAASLFAGTRDFTSMASSEGRGDAEPGQLPEKSKVRTVFLSELSLESGGEEMVYTVQATGFLHHMVRNMVGTLLEVGKGNLTPEDIPRILDARDRKAAGPTAPAKGLWLVEVEY